MLTIKNNDIGTNLANFRNASSFFPSLYLLTIIFLFGILFKTGFSKVSEQRKTLADIKAREAVLSDKEKELSKAKSDIVGIFYNEVSTALPEENPILLSLSQVKSLLNFYLLPLEGYSVSLGSEAGDSKTVTYSGFKLSVIGELDQILSFLREVELVSPLISVNKLSFWSEGDNLISAEITLNSFWSPFIAKVQTDAPLQKITDSDKNVLLDLSNLKQPSSSKLNPNGPFQRSDPFSTSGI